MSKEKLSALMDGELAPHELDALLNTLAQDDTLLETWSEWHLTSDVLQGEPCCVSRFMARFSERLADEPVVFTPRRMLRKPSRMRRFLVPITVAASVAFVSVAVWQISRPELENTPAAQFAAETEANLRAYLIAHRESDGNPFAGREVIYANFQSTDTH